MYETSQEILGRYKILRHLIKGNNPSMLLVSKIQSGQIVLFLQFSL
jgi:hypothetical protein